MNPRQRSIEKLLENLPLPPQGSGAILHHSALSDPQTGLCVGAVVVWAYGPVSAHLTVQELADTLYEELPAAAQLLIDCGESLMSAAVSEAKQKQADPSQP